MMTINTIIITFVTRSTPFCRPTEQIRKPAIVIISMVMTRIDGDESISLNFPVTASPVRPLNFPIKKL